MDSGPEWQLRLEKTWLLTEGQKAGKNLPFLTKEICGNNPISHASWVVAPTCCPAVFTDRNA